MFVLIQGFYETIEPRKSEILTALKANLANPILEKIVLLYESAGAIRDGELPTLDKVSDKLEIVPFSSQPLYSDFFEYANTKLVGKKCIIANTDIEIAFNFDFEVAQIYTLTRYEADGTKPQIDRYTRSHDCFIFTSPLNFDLGKIRIHQNKWGSESVMIATLIEAGYRLSNPCLSLKIIHHHGSNIREANRPTVSTPQQERYSIYPSYLEENQYQLAFNDVGMFWVPKNEAFIGNFIKKNIVWEEKIIKSVVPYFKKMNGIFLDVGGHIGTWTIALSKYIKDFRTVVIEAQSDVYQILERNIQINHLSDRVQSFFNAVGHLDDFEVSMEDSARDGPNIGKTAEEAEINIGGIQLGEGKRKVKMMKIDTLIKEKVGFIKIDIEGAEPLALWGAREIIRRDRPAILFERNHKIITDSMRKIMEISKEIAEFKIEDFVENYHPMIDLGDANYLLLPKPSFENKLIETIITPDCRLTVKENSLLQNQRPWGEIYQINKNTFLLIVATQFYLGHYFHGIIHWSNDTLWYVPPQSYSHTITIGLTCRNVERYLEKIFYNIEQLKILFNVAKIIFVESRSGDRTLEILQKSPYEVIHLDQKQESRTERLAEARNVILDQAVGDFLFMIDADDINENPWDLDGIRSCFYHQDWDVMTANSIKKYYDIWALRSKECPYDCWAEYERTKDRYNSVDKFIKLIPRGGPLIEVDSAFGGFGIYRLSAVRSSGARYSGLTPQGEICEHVPLNLKIKEAGGRIFINPRFLVNG